MRDFLVALSVLLLLASGAASAGAQTAPPLTVEQVAGLPSLIGTAPASPTWSPDSRWLAFRWNEAGWPFRDIYLVAADGSGRRRLTDLQRTHPAPAPAAGSSTEALAAQAAARAQAGVSEIVWAADSRSLWFVARGALYQVALSGGAPTAVSLGSGGVSALSLSPDGARLSFLRGGDLWLWTPGTAAPERLTSLAVDGIARVPLGTYNRADVEIGPGVWGASWSPYAWAPDGRTIALHIVDRRHIRRVPFPYFLGDETVVNELRRGYPGDENERRSLALLRLADRSIEPVALEAPGHRAISDFEWSSDGRLLIDQVEDTGITRWVWVLTPGSASVPRLVWQDRRESRIYPAFIARWHPDGRHIVIAADLVERDHLYLLDGQTRPGVSATPRPLTQGPWDVAGERGAPSLQFAGRDIIFTGNRKNPYERQVYRVHASGSAPVALTTRPGVHVPSVSPDGRWLASLWSDDTTPTELVMQPTMGSGPGQRVTTSPLPAFARIPWVTARYASFTNAVDGFAVHARILEPADLDRSRRYPVVFGPVYSNTVRHRWGGLTGTLQQLLVQRGYIVVQADVRGSVGYGRAFREAFLMDYGGKDLDDLEAVVRGVQALPYVDGRRIGIWGSSYGGLLSAFALLKRPGLFAAGVAGAPALDPHAFGPDDVAITRTPASHPDAFVRGSALELGEQLRDPLLIIHGLMDDVVPFRTTLALAERLMLLGKDFDLATAPAATHAWGAREHYAVFFYRKLVQFFDRHLGAAAAGR